MIMRCRCYAAVLLLALQLTQLGRARPCMILCACVQAGIESGIDTTTTLAPGQKFRSWEERKVPAHFDAFGALCRRKTTWPHTSAHVDSQLPYTGHILCTVLLRLACQACYGLLLSL